MVPPWLLSSLEILRQGVATNWWGLGCPQHCQGSSVGGYLASFLLGVVFTVTCGLLGFWIWFTGGLPARQQGPTFVQERGQPAPRASGAAVGARQRQRLQGYLDEPSQTHS